MNINAVLFDFDGVIADTLTFHVQAWRKVFHDYGVEILPLDVYLLEGRLAEEICRRLGQNKGLSLDERTIKALTKHKRIIYNQITEAKVYPATRRLIDSLKQASVKMALVTGSTLMNMEPIVGPNFLEQFDAIITGDKVANTKPHPEPYLAAAQQLAVRPDQCLVIENAPLGIRSAKQAGMYCIAVKTTIQDEQYLREADLIVEDMSHIPIQQFFKVTCSLQ